MIANNKDLIEKYQWFIDWWWLDESWVIWAKEFIKDLKATTESQKTTVPDVLLYEQWVIEWRRQANEESQEADGEWIRRVAKQIYDEEKLYEHCEVPILSIERIREILRDNLPKTNDNRIDELTYEQWFDIGRQVGIKEWIRSKEKPSELGSKIKDWVLYPCKKCWEMTCLCWEDSESEL